jgi:glycosyltransferase involved in cell wall biosynthesis
MDTAPQVSVVIPTYRRRDSVDQALKALAQQSLPAPAFEVIVSIDGSEDGTRELVAGFPADYALHGLWQLNRGRAAAVNAGLRQAAGRVVVLLDDDMEPAPGCLKAHWESHAGIGPRRGVVGAAPIRLDANAPRVAAEYVAPKFNRHLERLADADHRFGLRDFYTGNFSICRQVLLEVGQFDEDFKIYGNEDLELSYRLTRAGVALAYSAEALAYQHYTKDFPALARDTLAKGQTAVLLARKHPDTFNALQLSTYAQGSPAWRAVRAALLALAARRPGTLDTLVRGVGRLERRPGRVLRVAYRWVLDVCYWAGVQKALQGGAGGP